MRRRGADHLIPIREATGGPEKACPTKKVMCVVASALIASFRVSLAVAAVAFTISPAYANSSADVAAPLRAAQAAKPAAQGTNDAAFRQLFASWRSLEKGPALAAVRAPTVAAGQTAGIGQRAGIDQSAFIPSRMPVEGARLTSGFGMREHPVLGGHRIHKGIDLAAPVGTPVYAPADGTVARADWFSSYGLYIQIEHGASMETRYGHLSRVNVAAGQQVHRGDIIGFVGTTGRSTGPHLHYEVRVAGEAVNPITYMENPVMQQSPTALASAGGPDAD